jgi:hypothetical protein
MRELDKQNKQNDTEKKKSLADVRVSSALLNASISNALLQSSSETALDVRYVSKGSMREVWMCERMEVERGDMTRATS